MLSILHGGEGVAPPVRRFCLLRIRAICASSSSVASLRIIATQGGRSLARFHPGTVEGLDGFDYTIRPQLEPRVISLLALSLGFVEQKRNVLCLGKPGLGETRVAKAITHAACLAGYLTLCVLTAEMLKDLHASYADAAFKRTLRRYVKPACRGT